MKRMAMGASLSPLTRQAPSALLHSETEALDLWRMTLMETNDDAWLLSEHIL